MIYHKYILFKLFIKIYYKNTMYFGNVLQNLIFVVKKTLQFRYKKKPQNGA